MWVWDKNSTSDHAGSMLTWFLSIESSEVPIPAPGRDLIALVYELELSEKNLHVSTKEKNEIASSAALRAIRIIVRHSI